jgi:radical SAM/SPASM domain protein of ACGX system
MKKEKQTNVYFSLQWHITNACDQRCKHCYIFNSSEIEKKDPELSFDQCLSVIENFELFCKKLDAKPNIVITGGDPLLRNDVWKILETMKAKNIRFSILGNPFHLTDAVCEKLKGLGCTSYQMSLDGLQDKHDYIRKPGSFNATIEKIELLKKHNIKVNIMMTVSKFNETDLEPLIDLLVEKEIHSFAFARYVPQQNDIEQTFSPKEYKELLERAWSSYQKHESTNVSFSLKDHLWTLFLYERGLFKTREEDIIFEGCHCAIQSMSLLADGTVYACRRCESPVGNILTESFHDIFFGKKMFVYRDYKKMECSTCELFNYCRGCPAVSMGSYNNFYKKDPQCWKVL